MKKTPDWKLERYILGELNEDFSPSSQDLKRIEELKKQNKDFLKKHPFSMYEDKLKGKIFDKNKKNDPFSANNFSSFFRNLTLFLSKPQYSLVLGILIVFFVSLPMYNKMQVDKTNRLKGGINKISFYKDLNQEAKRIDTTYVLKEGDNIQLSYILSTYDYGFIFSVDSLGNHFVHLSDGGYAKSVNKKNKEVFLNSSFEVDNVGKHEIFYLVLGDYKFRVDDIISYFTSKSKLSNLGSNSKFSDFKKLKIKSYIFKKDN